MNYNSSKYSNPTTNQVDCVKLEEQIQHMLVIASRYLSEFEMSRYIRPNRESCFAIYFLGRIIGKDNSSIIVSNPLFPSRKFQDILVKLSKSILDAESQEMILACPTTMTRLFALGIHIGNIESHKICSDIIRCSR